MTKADQDLLGEFIRDQSQDAFTALVQRHLGLVHCAALRQVHSPQLAEEVAQSVFTDLARAAARLKPGTILTAWLYEVTRRTAINVVRGEARRQLREQIALEMNAMNATADDWTQIEPLLDDAMHALDDIDRTAILLRFFENKSLREVGESLGTTDDTARKRVNRAVERLREFFAKRGVTVGASGLVVVISANAVQTAPAGLAVTISTAAALGSTTILATTTVTKALAMTTAQKVLIVAALTAATGTGIYKAVQVSTLRTQVETTRQQQQQLATQLDQLTRERDAATSQLAALRKGNPALDNTSELLRLRGEVTRLRMETERLSKLKVDEATDPVLSEEDAGKRNADLLKSYFDLNSAMKIPEDELKEEAQFSASFRSLAAKMAGFTNTILRTPKDYRRAAAELRRLAEGRFAQNHFAAAARKYFEANGKKFPVSVAELQPYFETSAASPAWKSILERYEVQPSSNFPHMASKLESDWLITQRSLVDEEFDHRIYVAPGLFMQNLDRRKPRD